MVLRRYNKNLKIIRGDARDDRLTKEQLKKVDAAFPPPISLYSKLKVSAEKYISESKNWILFRFATVFGISPHMRLDLLVNDFTYQALNDRFIVLFESSFRRAYLHIKDVSKAFIFCLNNFKHLKEAVYNVKLHDINLTKFQLCEEIKK